MGARGLNIESAYNECPMTQQAKARKQRKTRPPVPTSKRTKASKTQMPFEQAYPATAQWVESYGWIEMGQDDYSGSMVRALDIGGMVWEGKTKYPSLDDLLRDLENGLTAWFEENG